MDDGTAAQGTLLRDLVCKACGNLFPSEIKPGSPPGACSDKCTRSLVAARNRRWRAKNPEHNSAWKKDNRAAHQAQRRAYYERNRQDIIDKATAWSVAHRERSNRIKAVASAVRRSRLSDDPVTREYALILLCDPCAYCGEAAESIDHIVPLSRGGRDTWENLTAACRPCNSQKHTQDLAFWLIRRRERGEGDAFF